MLQKVKPSLFWFLEPDAVLDILNPGGGKYAYSKFLPVAVRKMLGNGLKISVPVNGAKILSK